MVRDIIRVEQYYERVRHKNRCIEFKLVSSVIMSAESSVEKG